MAFHPWGLRDRTMRLFLGWFRLHEETWSRERCEHGSVTASILHWRMWRLFIEWSRFYEEPRIGWRCELGFLTVLHLRMMRGWFWFPEQTWFRWRFDHGSTTTLHSLFTWYATHIVHYGRLDQFKPAGGRELDWRPVKPWFGAFVI